LINKDDERPSNGFPWADFLKWAIVWQVCMVWPTGGDLKILGDNYRHDSSSTTAVERLLGPARAERAAAGDYDPEEATDEEEELSPEERGAYLKPWTYGAFAAYCDTTLCYSRPCRAEGRA
jgi:hypothetical protein